MDKYHWPETMGPVKDNLKPIDDWDPQFVVDNMCSDEGTDICIDTPGSEKYARDSKKWFCKCPMDDETTQNVAANCKYCLFGDANTKERIADLNQRLLKNKFLKLLND